MTVPLLALPYGVACIEKHIGLDRALQLEDYVSALPPEAFARLVRSIRQLEPAVGSEALKLTPTELTYRQKAVKAVVARRGLRQGQVITVEDVRLKRSGAPRPSHSLHRIEDVLGRRLSADASANQPVTKDMIR